MLKREFKSIIEGKEDRDEATAEVFTYPSLTCSHTYIQNIRLFTVNKNTYAVPSGVSRKSSFV